MMPHHNFSNIIGFELVYGGTLILFLLIYLALMAYSDEKDGWKMSTPPSELIRVIIKFSGFILIAQISTIPIFFIALGILTLTGIL